MNALDRRFQKIEHSLLRWSSLPGDDRLTRVFRQLSRGVWTTLHHGRHPLSQGRRAQAVGNLWAWQAWRRVVKEPVLVELQTGAKLLCPTWSALAGSWVSIGVHEAELFFTADVVREHDTFLDVGANIGVYAVTAARHGARVVAFEPTAAARRSIATNAKLNGVSDRVVTSEFALADYDGSAFFTVGGEVGDHLVADASQGLPVQVRKLDSCLPGLLSSPLRVDWIKIDAEGSDEAVLRGAAETLAANRPTLIVEIWSGGRSIRGLLSGLGYEFYAYDYQSRTLSTLPESYTGSGNLIAIHRDRLETVRERIASAAPWVRRVPRAHWQRTGSPA